MKKLILLLAMFALVGCGPPVATETSAVIDTQLNERLIYFYDRGDTDKLMISYICIDGVEYLQIYGNEYKQGFYGITTHLNNNGLPVLCE